MFSQAGGGESCTAVFPANHVVKVAQAAIELGPVSHAGIDQVQKRPRRLIPRCRNAPQIPPLPFLVGAAALRSP